MLKSRPKPKATVLTEEQKWRVFCEATWQKLSVGQAQLFLCMSVDMLALCLSVWALRLDRLHSTTQLNPSRPFPGAGMGYDLQNDTPI